MSDAATHDLVQRVTELLRPGEIALAGAIVHTECAGDQEIEMHQITLEVGELIAEQAGVEEWYVYSGNDSAEFGANQHQGLTVGDDGFIWECQQLLREGTYDIVVYYEANVGHDDVIAAIADAGYDVTGVEPPE